MKKLSIVLTVLFALATLISAAYATEETKVGDGAKMPEILKKAYEKSAANAAYTLTAKVKVQGQEMSSVTKAFFKDAKHYRMDSEMMGQKTRMVVDGDMAWTYMEAANMIMKMPVPPSPTEVKNTVTYVEGKEGDNATFTCTDTTTKIKVVIAVNPKENLPVKMTTFDEKGALMSESTYSDWKFDKIDDSMFKKPEGAKEMEAPKMPEQK